MGSAQEFSEAVARWKVAESTFRAAKLAYDLAYGKALLASAASSADKRVADADIASATQRAAADKAEIEARATEHYMMFLRNVEAA